MLVCKVEGDDENLVTNYVEFLYVNEIDLIGTKKSAIWKFKEDLNKGRVCDCFLWKHTSY